jgi:circadian clock protein KaiC
MNQLVRASTGIPGLDDILGGGLFTNRLYLVEGMPGSGKTTMAFQFLLDGVRRGESVLYVTLSETASEIQAVADSHGWDLRNVNIRELLPGTDAVRLTEQYTVFHPSEVELSDTTQKILADVERIKPTRLVFDSLSELRLLSGTALRYRRQILALKQYFAGKQCTVLLLDDLSGGTKHDLQVHSIAHGSILLEHSMPNFGSMRRRLSITKYRGSSFRGGYHDYVIRRGGLEVFPRLVAAEHRGPSSRARVASKIDGLDRLMGGGLERGTSTLFVGAAGTGKSTIASLFCGNAARTGVKSSLFIFDESANTLLSRLEGLGIDFARHVDAGLITVNQIDPAENSPGELVQRIRNEVEERGVEVIVIDSLNGYLNSMPDENYLIIQLHEMLTYLGQHGVATILIAAHSGLIGSNMQAPVDASYLADAVVLIRYYEAEGEVRQAISVVKMRGGAHERTIRDFSMSAGNIKVGEPLRNYRGVLTGVPEKRS